MFKNPFKKNKPEEPEEELVPTPIPALIAILVNKEREKGSPLSESEVLEIRDNAVCMMLPISAKEKMEESRGYPDLNPEYIYGSNGRRLELNSLKTHNKAKQHQTLQYQTLRVIKTLAA